MLSTAQQVGGAVGVAVIGVAFFAGGTIVHAFVVRLCVVAALTVLTAVRAQLLRHQLGCGECAAVAQNSPFWATAACA